MRYKTEFARETMQPSRKNVKVVVLGDIGRSPRMQYHSISLAEMGHQVDVIGYGETDPMQHVKLEPKIFYHYLLPVPKIPVKLINYVFKTVLQALNLMFLLLVTTKSDIVMVQNPPAIPSLVVCWIYAKIVKAKLIIDWHNYAHTIMALSVGNGSALVKVTRKVEAFIGRRADYNFCVTEAMKQDLIANWGVSAVTLYDRPPEIFKSIPTEEKHSFLTRFSKEFDGIVTDNEGNRPGLLVSSTSWTEDEDFSILLSALQDYEDHWKNGNQRNLPKLVCVITGKGPLKEHYSKIVHDLGWKHVTVITPWLEASDYPLILASADLGVSLHTSSSGLDLPMKVVDMFGCGLPVCACYFKCLDELVRHGENGYTFRSSQELSKLVLDWFENFPHNDEQKDVERTFKTELKTFQNTRWRDNWLRVAAPCFK